MAQPNVTGESEKKGEDRGGKVLNVYLPSQALTFKAFMQPHHLPPLLEAIWKLPHLKLLSLIAAPNAKARHSSRFRNWGRHWGRELSCRMNGG